MTSARGLVEPGSPEAPLRNVEILDAGGDFDRAVAQSRKRGFFGRSTFDFFSPVIA